MQPSKRNGEVKPAGPGLGGHIPPRNRRDRTDINEVPPKVEGDPVQEPADGSGTGVPPQWPDFGHPLEGAD